MVWVYHEYDVYLILLWLFEWSLCANYLTPWYMDFLEVLKVTQLVKKFLNFCGTIGFITVFTQPAIEPSSEPGECSPHTHILQGAYMRASC